MRGLPVPARHRPSKEARVARAGAKRECLGNVERPNARNAQEHSTVAQPTPLTSSTTATISTKYLDTPEVAAYLRKKPITIKKWRANDLDGFADIWFRTGTRSLVTTTAHVDAWLAIRQGLRPSTPARVNERKRLAPSTLPVETVQVVVLRPTGAKSTDPANDTR